MHQKIVVLLGTTIFFKEYVGILLINKIEISINKNGTKTKLLGLKKGCSKEEVLKVAKKLQQKIHPDKNTEIRTEELSKLVNQAVDKIIKTDFS